MLTITSLYGGLLGLWFLVLSFHVIRYRFTGVSLGDGGRPEIMRAIRAHGNFSEYVPLVLVLLAVLETGGTVAAWVLHLIGACLLIGRLLHGISLGFTKKWVPGRMGGMILTFTALLVASLLCIWRGIAVLVL